MYDIVKLRREEFPLSADLIYFNHAAISPLPQRSMRRMIEVAEQLARNPSVFFPERFDQMKQALGAGARMLFGARRDDEMVPITSTSSGINALAQAIPWRAGDNVVYCDHEFPSNVFPWRWVGQDRGVEVREVPAIDGGLTIENLAPAVDEHTRVVAVSAIQFFTGHRTDLTAIGAFCHERGILLAVDAIQAVGHVPIDVGAMHIDMLVTGGQKSVLAVPGIGFLYVRNPLCAQLEPRHVGANSVRDYAHWLDYDMRPLPGAPRFSMGSPNLPGLAALLGSLDLLCELGVANIDKHTSALAEYAAGRLSELGYRVIMPADAHANIVTFATGRSLEATEAMVASLRANQVVIGRHLDRPGNHFIRLSFHCYNTEAEVDRFMALLADL